MKRKKYGSSDKKIIFTFADIGRYTQDLLDSFFKSKFLKYPFSEIKLDHYVELLEQTDDYGKVFIKKTEIVYYPK